MSFYDKMENEVTKKLTENGAPTYSSSLNKNLDFFATAGAIRSWDEKDIQVLFQDAFYEDRETALRNLVHLRDIRNGGLGERKAFRASLGVLLNDPSKMYIVRRMLPYLPYLGRWDDVVYVFANTDSEAIKQTVATLISKQLNEDMIATSKNETVSLLAKWMPSANASSKETKKTARELIKYLYGSYSPRNEKAYRKLLSFLRNHLKVVEVNMSAKKWDKIDYSHVPSLAALKYKTAFYRNDEERYRKYLDGLSTGETKVNASVTYPYQIVEKYGYSYDVLLEQAWKSLPNYLEGVSERAIVVADTSGSMSGTPMNVSISLAIYCAQRLQGEFHGKYISFSANPTLNTVHDDATLQENIERVRRTDWGMNTDINKVFQLILDTGIKHQMSQDEMPDKILIISDQEFDEANGGLTYWGPSAEPLTPTSYQHAKMKFESHGYKIPQVIFWNVNARSKTIPVRKDEVGTALVSGLTPSIFKTVLNGKILNPEQLMKDTLFVEKYDFVKDLLK